MSGKAILNLKGGFWQPADRRSALVRPFRPQLTNLAVLIQRMAAKGQCRPIAGSRDPLLTGAPLTSYMTSGVVNPIVYGGSVMFSDVFVVIHFNSSVA